MTRKITTRALPMLLAGTVIAVATGACGAGGAGPHIDPLPSWVDGTTKSALLQFVADVTLEGGPKYVRPEERIATFDNDGTLWCEQPVVQLAYVMYRIKEMAPEHPEWKDNPPFEAALAGDMDYLVDDLTKGGTGIVQLFEAAHTGMSLSEFRGAVRNFFDNARHPRYEVPFDQVA